MKKKIQFFEAKEINLVELNLPIEVDFNSGLFSFELLDDVKDDVIIREDIEL